jgi:hypothetical protein
MYTRNCLVHITISRYISPKIPSFDKQQPGWRSPFRWQPVFSTKYFFDPLFSSPKGHPISQLPTFMLRNHVQPQPLIVGDSDETTIAPLVATFGVLAF